MGLIKCPECGKSISDKATICVGCGFPVSEWLLRIKRRREREKENKERKEKLLAYEKEAEIKYANLKDKRNISFRHKEKIIEIQDGKLTLRFPRNMTITDDIWNFTLEYFSISMGINVGLGIYNISKGYTSGVVDIVCKGTEKNSLILFKEIMENNGLYMARSKFNFLYLKNDLDKKLEQNRQEQFQKIMNSVNN